MVLDHGRKRLGAHVFLLALALAASAATVWAEPLRLPRAFDYRGDTARIPGEVVLTLTSGKYRLVQVKDGEEIVVVEGCGQTTAPGEPQLPERLVEAALPPNVDWGTLSLDTTVVESEEIPGRHEIRPAPVPQPVTDKDLLADTRPSLGGRILETRIKEIFTRDAFHPHESVRLAGGAQMRKWRFAKLAFAPVRYNPVAGKLVLLKRVQVKIKFMRIGREIYRTDPLLRDKLMTRRRSGGW